MHYSSKDRERYTKSAFNIGPPIHFLLSLIDKSKRERDRERETERERQRERDRERDRESERERFP